jgi:hypothetical protein
MVSSTSRTSAHIRCELIYGHLSGLQVYTSSLFSSPLPSLQGTTRRPKLAHLGSSLVSHRTFANDSSQHPCPALGNLYLSSCPGKKGGAYVITAFDGFTNDVKVRLTGPVRGRGAICRDLKQDLRRIKALGVGCIVWCVKFRASYGLVAYRRTVALMTRS